MFEPLINIKFVPNKPELEIFWKKIFFRWKMFKPLKSIIFVPNKHESERFWGKYLSVKNCLKRSKASYFCLINEIIMNSKDFEKKIFFRQKLFEMLKSIIFVSNKHESERFWRKYLSVKNCLKRSKASYLCLINMNLKDFVENIFRSKTVWNAQKHHICA